MTKREELKKRYNECSVCGRYCKKTRNKCSLCRANKTKKVSAGYKRRIALAKKRGY